MNRLASSSDLSAGLRTLVVIYFVASLAHFSHNAEYIAFYPNMPSWLTRQHVYLAWLMVTAVGVLGWLLTKAQLQLLGLSVLGIYGALGLDGLLHYTLALCSEHTLLTNLTIWSEAAAGLVLMMVCAVALSRRLHSRLSPQSTARMGRDGYASMPRRRP
jgi:hypothetical protein